MNTDSYISCIGRYRKLLSDIDTASQELSVIENDDALDHVDRHIRMGELKRHLYEMTSYVNELECYLIEQGGEPYYEES